MLLLTITDIDKQQTRRHWNYYKTSHSWIIMVFMMLWYTEMLRQISGFPIGYFIL